MCKTLGDAILPAKPDCLDLVGLLLGWATKLLRGERASHLGIPLQLLSVSAERDPTFVCASMLDKWGLPCGLEA